MKAASRFEDHHFWVVMVMVTVAVVVGLASYFRVCLPGPVGPVKFPHVMGIGGAALVATVVPVYSILKRRRPEAIRALLKMHMYGNLFAFQLITIHFGYRSSEMGTEVNDTGTGLLLYIVALLLVTTGILRRFRIAATQIKVWSFLHVSFMVSFYLIVIRYALRALKIV